MTLTAFVVADSGRRRFEADPTVGLWPERTKAALVLRNAKSGDKFTLHFAVAQFGSFSIRINKNAKVQGTRITASAPLFFLSLAFDVTSASLSLKRRR